MEPSKTTSPEVRGIPPVALAAAVFALAATGRAILDADEGVYAHIPQQMLERGDWITPYVNGVRSLDKPPLLYWLTALSYSLFGVNAFAAHVPGILGVAGTTWVVQRLGGRYAAYAFAFSVGTFLFNLELMHDILLVFFVTLAVYFLTLSYQGEGRWPVIGFFVAVAGAFLSKGLIGVAFPVGIAVVYMTVTRQLPKVRLPWLLSGGLLFVVLAAPWHVAMEMRNPGFLEIHFFEEQILRFFNKREPVDYESVPLLLFWVLVPVWLFPWSSFLPAAWANRKRLLLPLCWFGLMLAFFSVSSRLEHYTFPLLPPLALMVGDALTERGRRLIWSFRFLGALGGILLAASAVLAWFRFAETMLRGPGGSLISRNQDNDFTLMFELPPEILHELLIPAIAVTFCLGLGLLVAFRFAKRDRLQPAIAALLAGMVVFQLSAVHSLRICEDFVSSKRFGLALAEVARPGDKAVIVGDYETANSINFYAPIQLLVCEGRAASLGPGLRFPDAPKITLTRTELQRRWNSDARLFVLVDEDRIEEMKLHSGVRLFAIAGRVLLVNSTDDLKGSPGLAQAR